MKSYSKDNFCKIKKYYSFKLFFIKKTSLFELITIKLYKVYY